MDLRERPSGTTHRHPWERARADFFARLVEEQLAPRAPLRVLDVGAGDAFLAETLLATLPPGSAITCFDPHYDHQQLVAARPGLALVRERPAERFGLVLALDVIEHVADDRAFLRALAAESLAADGALLVSVPAFMALYTRHDEVLGHRRRYGSAELRAALGDAGLTPTAAGGLFTSLLVPRAAAKLLERARGVRAAPTDTPPAAHAETGLTRWRAGALVTGAVTRALALDGWLSRQAARRGVPLPGLSLWALARKAPS